MKVVKLLKDNENCSSKTKIFHIKQKLKMKENKKDK